MDAAFEQLSNLVEEQLREERALEDLEAQIEAAKARVKTLSEQSIPDLMARMRLKECTTLKGRKVTVKRTIRASIPSAEKDAVLHAAGLRWLIDNGQAGVIKNVVAVKLERGEDSKAKQIADELRERGLHPDVKSWVEPQTLGKLVRELLERGVNVPFEPLGVFDQNVAKIV